MPLYGVKFVWSEMDNIDTISVMKTLRTAITAIVLLTLPVLVLAYEFDPGGVIQETTGLSGKDPKLITIAVVQYVLGLLALITVIFLIWAGIDWMTAAGNEERVARAKKTIRNAVVGLVVILLSWALASFVANTFLNVST